MPVSVPQPIKDELARRLREFEDERGLNHREAAWALKVHPENYIKWVVAKAFPSKKNLRQIEAGGIPCLDLLTDGAVSGPRLDELASDLRALREQVEAMVDDLRRREGQG